MRGKARAINLLARFTRRGWRAGLLAGVLAGGLKCVRPRGRVAVENLRLAYPEATERWIRATVNGVYEHIAWMTAEYLALVKAPSQALDWIVTVKGKEILDQVKSAGSGAIILTGHIGNWELLAAWLAQSGYPLSAVVRNPDDEDLAELISAYRSGVGVGVFEKKFVMKDAVRFARNGGFLGLLPDQAWNTTGVSSRFLGSTCYTARGPAAIARLSGAPVVPVVSYRIAPFKHEVRICEPLPMVKTQDSEESLRENTARMNRALEKMILARPEQWLWLHRRWRY